MGSRIVIEVEGSGDFETACRLRVDRHLIAENLTPEETGVFSSKSWIAFPTSSTLRKTRESLGRQSSRGLVGVEELDLQRWLVDRIGITPECVPYLPAARTAWLLRRRQDSG